MEKKKIFVIVTALVIVFGGLALLALFPSARVDIDGVTACVVTTETAERTMTESDAQAAAELLNGHRFYRDEPSCGFSEIASFTITSSSGADTFYIARDGCPFLYAPDSGKYVQLTESEITALHKILASYGLTVPCV